MGFKLRPDFEKDLIMQKPDRFLDRNQEVIILSFPPNVSIDTE